MWSEVVPSPPGVMELLEKVSRDQNSLFELHNKMFREQQQLFAKVQQIYDHLVLTPPTQPMPPLHTEAPPMPLPHTEPSPMQPLHTEASPMQLPHTQATPTTTYMREQRCLFADIPPPPKGNELPESEIHEEQLIPVDVVLQKYSSWLVDNKFSALAVKLAREVFFGDSVLKKCTPRGFGEFPALPNRGLNQLKKTLFDAFPNYWTKPEAFEVKWVAAQENIGQTCKRLRRLNPL